jgi:hypothetical protein
MTLVAASIFFAITPCLGQSVAPDHPFVGTWKITLSLSNGTCDEIYSVRVDGTTLVTSAEEVGESEYKISEGPSEKGFYRWIDTVTKSNGKKDCLGQITPVGDVATNYIVFHPSGDMFLICIEESLDRCVGPFVRQKGGDA